MVRLIIHITKLNEFICNDVSICCKIITTSQTFSTLYSPIGSWKTQFECKCDFDEDTIIEIWTEKKKLGSMTLSVAGHSDTPFNIAKLHWYVVKDLKNKKMGLLGIKIGCINEKSKSKFHDDDIFELLEKESSESFKKSMRVTEQTLNIAGATNEKLYSQNQKLLKAEANVDQIQDDIKESKREIRSIKSVKGQIANSLTSSKYTHDTQFNLINKQTTRTTPILSLGSGELDNLSANVSMLKQAALIMGEQLSTDQIDRLHEKSNKSNTDIKKITSTIRKI